MPTGTYVQFEAKDEGSRRPPIDELRRGRNGRPFSFRRHKSSGRQSSSGDRLHGPAKDPDSSFADFLQSPSRFTMLSAGQGTGKLGMIDGGALWLSFAF